MEIQLNQTMEQQTATDLAFKRVESLNVLGLFFCKKTRKNVLTQGQGLVGVSRKTRKIQTPGAKPSHGPTAPETGTAINRCCVGWSCWAVVTQTRRFFAKFEETMHRQTSASHSSALDIGPYTQVNTRRGCTLCTWLVHLRHGSRSRRWSLLPGRTHCRFETNLRHIGVDIRRRDVSGRGQVR